MQQQLLYLGEGDVVVQQQQQVDWGGGGIDRQQQPLQQIFGGVGCIIPQQQQQPQQLCWEAGGVLPQEQEQSQQQLHWGEDVVPQERQQPQQQQQLFWEASHVVHQQQLQQQLVACGELAQPHPLDELQGGSTLPAGSNVLSSGLPWPSDGPIFSSVPLPLCPSSPGAQTAASLGRPPSPVPPPAGPSGPPSSAAPELLQGRESGSSSRDGEAAAGSSSSGSGEGVAGGVGLAANLPDPRLRVLQEGSQRLREDMRVLRERFG